MKTAKAVKSFLEAKPDFSPRTLEQYTGALEVVKCGCPDLPQKPDALRRLLNQMGTPWVRDASWRCWNSFFHWCHIEYDVRNPMERVERPKRPDIEMKALEPEELSMVLAAAASTRDKAVLALALDVGLRASEFGRLRVEDIGQDTLWVWGKGNKRVRVPISPDTRRLIELLIAEDGIKGPQSLIFPGLDGKPISRFTVYRIVRSCMDKAGIAGPKRGPHCLRHSLGMNYIANGGDPFSLRRIMRHSNISTTQKYVNLSMNKIVEQHNQHSPIRQALLGAQGLLVKRELLEEAESIIKKK